MTRRREVLGDLPQPLCEPTCTASAAWNGCHNDGGRIIHIGSSTTTGPMPGTGLYGSSKVAARHFVGVLALELVPQAVTSDTILPTTIDGSGVFTDLAEQDPMRKQLSQLRLGVCMGRPGDVADAAEYLASELSSFVSG